jgi:hypothetical protein
MKLSKNLAKNIAAALSVLAVLAAGNHLMAQGETWTMVAPMPIERFGMVAGVVNNKFFAIGGFNNNIGAPLATTVEVYDPVANTWSTKTPMPTRRVAAAAGVVNGILYVTGGTSYVGDLYATVDAYHPATDTWTTTAPMPGVRSGHGCAVVNGILYVMGGWDGGFVGRTHTLWAYNPATDHWTVKSPMPTGRQLFASVSVNGIIYVIGGEITGNSEIGTVEAYNPATDTWTTKAPMPTPRLALDAGVLKSIIYAVGGTTEVGYESTGKGLSTVEAYDPVADKWTSKTPMPTARTELSVNVIGNVLYAAGGRTNSNTAVPAMEAFTNTSITTPPTIECSGSLVLECTNGSAVGTVQAEVQDTNGFALQVMWSVDGTPTQTNNIASGGAITGSNVTFTATFESGAHEVEVSASNGLTNATMCSTTVTVRDTTPPEMLSMAATPAVLWPPNHRLIPVTLTVDAVDNCDPSPVVRIIQVTSNEPENRFAPDWEITGPLSVNLRAERLGARHGRVYLITVQCEDSGGNISFGSVQVVVPHNN